MRAAAMLAVFALAGCTGEDSKPSQSVPPWPMDGAGEQGEAQGTSSAEEGVTSNTGGPTADTASSTGSNTTGTGDSTATTAEAETEGAIVHCSLEVLLPGTDPTTLIDYGDAPGQIPTEIGEALSRNCGCHYTDETDDLVDYEDEDMPIATWADWHVPFDGNLPMNFDGTVWEANMLRITFEQPLPMPPNDCNIDGHGTTMSEDDRVLFSRWFDAGAPAAENWPP